MRCKAAMIVFMHKGATSAMPGGIRITQVLVVDVGVTTPGKVLVRAPLPSNTTAMVPRSATPSITTRSCYHLRCQAGTQVASSTEAEAGTAVVAMVESTSAVVAGADQIMAAAAGPSPASLSVCGAQRR